MTIKELASVTPEPIYIVIVFKNAGYDEIIYTPSIAGLVDNLVIEKIELDVDVDTNPQIRAIIKFQPVTE